MKTYKLLRQTNMGLSIGALNVGIDLVQQLKRAGQLENIGMGMTAIQEKRWIIKIVILQIMWNILNPIWHALLLLFSRGFMKGC